MKKKEKKRKQLNILNIFKCGFSVVTMFIPQSVLAKAASGIAIWAVESLVKNTKTKIDDKGLEIVKKVIKNG
jgi:hypothetical protein